MKQTKPIFVVSDLHLGSGGRRDNFATYGREKQFFDFLDFVEKNDGELIITGDLVDMWRFRIRRILRRYAELFDRLTQMNVSYIVGNHDHAMEELAEHRILPHRFFAKTTRPFIRKIGDKKFKFMHGHELDPFNSRIKHLWGRIICISAGAAEWINGAPFYSTETIEKILINLEEKLRELWIMFCLELKEKFNYEICFKSSESRLKNIRTKKLIARHQDYKNSHGHDITISAHTHRVGSFKNWYFNSGSWVGETNNFLRILPDGGTSIFDWTAVGPKKNQTILCA